MPDHISARVKDVPSIMKGLPDTIGILQQADYDPVMAAAPTALH